MNIFKMIAAARSVVSDDKGVTALEYGMIAALIAAVIVTTVATINRRHIYLPVPLAVR